MYVVRHGETDGNRNGLMLGRTDLPLNSEGIRHAHWLAERLVVTKCERVFSSDLLRARETAEIICAVLKRPMIIEKLLREMDYGDIDGLPISEIRETDFGRKRQHDRFGFKAPNGESYIDVLGRVKQFFLKYDLCNKFNNSIIVSHLGVIRMIMYNLGNMNARTASSLEFSHTQISQLSFDAGQWRVI